jgi:hypothetical protein
LKKLLTKPSASKDGAPLVEISIGDVLVTVTASQAEEIAVALMRAATAARYEAGLSDLLRDKGKGTKADAEIAKLRAKIETRRIKRN